MSTIIWLCLECNQESFWIFLYGIGEIVRVELELLQFLVFLIHLGIVNLHNLLVGSHNMFDGSIVPDDSVLMLRPTLIAFITGSPFFLVDV